MNIRAALIVAHGQPSDPEPAEAELAALAARVAGHLPGWRLGSATLAAPGALAAAVADLGPQGLIYPLFMACGWFTRTHLPARMAAAGGGAWRVLPPFGCDPGVQSLTERLAVEAAEAAGLAPREAALLLAAHGSGRSSAPSDIARAMAARLERAGFARAEAAFIDQSPRIAEARGYAENALCLPFFAARGGHVAEDLPAALAEAGFGGRLLPAVGLDARVPGLIAEALRRAVDDPARGCAGVLCGASAEP